MELFSVRGQGNYLPEFPTLGVSTLAGIKSISFGSIRLGFVFTFRRIR